MAFSAAQVVIQTLLTDCDLQYYILLWCCNRRPHGFESLTLDNFRCIAVLGRGHFGKVRIYFRFMRDCVINFISDCSVIEYGGYCCWCYLLLIIWGLVVRSEFLFTKLGISSSMQKLISYVPLHVNTVNFLQHEWVQERNSASCEWRNHDSKKCSSFN
jgi:hypothetical protein